VLFLAISTYILCINCHFASFGFLKKSLAKTSLYGLLPSVRLQKRRTARVPFCIGGI
jgi:hypothetical protein